MAKAIGVNFINDSPWFKTWAMWKTMNCKRFNGFLSCKKIG